MELTTLLTGLAFGESPRWHDGRLWICDWMDQEIVAVDPAGRHEVILSVPFSSIPFSIDWLSDGRLIVVSSSDRPVLRQEADGSLVEHVTSAHGWNEVVADGRGNLYVNGAGFDMMAGAPFAPGVVALVSATGSVETVADDIAFPNGMAITSDGSTLIVADSYSHQLTGFAIQPDGSLSERRVWADLGEGVPDGICLDAEGAVWYADVPHARCVRVREGGEVLQVVQADRGCFACMLGGPDGTTLFITAAEWHGFERMADGPKTGVVFTANAPAPHGGRP
jgi:sugar lactone lactonase YvrE